jgi:hypothetical protein
MAMTGRLYSASFSNVAVSAVQDMLGIYAGVKVLGIHSVNIGQISQTSVESLRLRLRMLPATVTSGSVGSAVTPRPLVSGDAAATATARANDTTQATSSGTAIDIWDDVWNLVNGYVWMPPVVGRPFIIPPSGAFILSLDSAPAAARTTNASVVFEELP